MCLVGVVVRRYIDFLILLFHTPVVSALFCSSIPTFCSFLKMFFVLYTYILVPYLTTCHYTRAEVTSLSKKGRNNKQKHLKIQLNVM